MATGRDHGGDLDRARDRFGAGDWIDLSTGINRLPWPVPPLPAQCWTALPTASAMAGLIAAARDAYGAAKPGIVPLAGAQAAIQLVPRLRAPGRARVLGPTYNEHAAALAAQGWQVDTVAEAAELAGADLAVVVNPNNPDGRSHSQAALLELAGQVGLMVVDESFADAEPALSLAARAGGNLVVLRSFGKFYGLAGLRLGFALAAPDLAARMTALAGPWAVSGPAIAVGATALADRAWAEATRKRLAVDALRLDALAAAAGWRLVGGCALFRLYETPDAEAAQAALARHHIWTRRFPWHERWLRLGLPGGPDEWQRLAAALAV